MGDVVGGNVAVNGFHCEALDEGISVGIDRAEPNPIDLTEGADA